MASRHAYLIMAHDQPAMLQRLIYEIDDERNDIFVHIDKKASFDGSQLHASHSGLTVLTDRIDGRWADYSLVEIEFALLDAAVASGRKYSYYHLLSGVDVVVKTQDHIHEECQRLQGTEFIAFAPYDASKELHWRSGHRFLFLKNLRKPSLAERALRQLYIHIQDLLGLSMDVATLRKGSQWWSITHDFAKYALSKRDEMERRFQGTYAPDEVVFQTLAANSAFVERVCIGADEFDGSRRFIKWSDGALVDLTTQMIEEARKSNRWFARKLPANLSNTI
ncbi:MAG: beta-1,6-N-acetylglucosaminyltransferase [Bacteroides sp.]|nr:beta-1,6-N-acetylglucosaminyltransferase [Bacteroides sp.]MCM1413239.1 beta-1,6-N-acetylglucosaminyltransferase [Bacteroides sp.]MCM1471451.1 beta-1,6-N-acetylglucosaminyltransferase [Bacteroides sp.]